MSEHIMELDELKEAWKTLDKRLEQQGALNLHVFRQHRMDKLKSSLRPLSWGQALQIVVGALLALWGGSFWFDHRDIAHLLVAGLIVHAYGIVLIGFGAAMQTFLHRIDYSAPVLAIQRQLAHLRQIHIRGGMLAGLSWWFLWMPFLMMFFMSRHGADLYATAPSVIWIGTAVGIAGLLVNLWLHRWSRHPSRPRLAKVIEDSATGASLRKAQAYLDEIAQFEQE